MNVAFGSKSSEENAKRLASRCRMLAATNASSEQQPIFANKIPGKETIEAAGMCLFLPEISL